ncbi:MAG: hypothetical protein ACKOC5_12765, partial [Chloroflexota bacterium]
RALNEQLRQGAAAYNYGGEEGLRQRGSAGARFSDFSLEQQGDIVRHYYERLARGQEAGAWQRYVADLQGRDSAARRA